MNVHRNSWIIGRVRTRRADFERRLLMAGSADHFSAAHRSPWTLTTSPLDIHHILMIRPISGTGDFQAMHQNIVPQGHSSFAAVLGNMHDSPVRWSCDSLCFMYVKVTSIQFHQSLIVSSHPVCRTGRMFSGFLFHHTLMFSQIATVTTDDDAIQSCKTIALHYRRPVAIQVEICTMYMQLMLQILR